MKALVVNNGSEHLPLLAESFPGAEVTVVPWNGLKDVRIGDFDFAVLSGSSTLPVAGHEEDFRDELALIRESKIPILGVCLGFELIVAAFGGKLKRLHNKQKGILELTMKTPDPIFAGIDHATFYEGHRWIAETVPEDFVVLAESSHGVEAVKHRDRMIYGVQFHPEKFPEETEGRRILANFVGIAMKQ